jgi:hypothetical protein
MRISEPAVEVVLSAGAVAPKHQQTGPTREGVSPEAMMTANDAEKRFAWQPIEQRRGLEVQ